MLNGLEISTRLSPNLETVRGDFRELQQVMLNLILNAAAMENTPPSKRKIIITTSMADRSTVAASVRDYGTGMDSAAFEQLFEAFYTTKPDERWISWKNPSAKTGSWKRLQPASKSIAVFEKNACKSTCCANGWKA